MRNSDSVKALIRNAFANAEYPGDGALRGSDYGDEPYLLEEEFRGKTHWQTLDADFLDQAPSGYASALSFFSDQAFRFYLPAYLIADMDGRLECADVVFHLCHGLDDEKRGEQINPEWYGERTWFDAATDKFSKFTDDQVKAVVAYLRYKCQAMDPRELYRQFIEQALRNYWLERAGEAPQL